MENREREILITGGSPETGEALEQEVATSYRDFLKEHTPVNFGKEGLIYFMGATDMSPTILRLLEESGIAYRDSAVKVLKLYTVGQASREFGLQKQAHRIIESHIAENPGQAGDYARVPAPLDQRTIDIDEETRLTLNREGAHITGNKVEIMVMDFIHGDDLATVMYKWIIDHCPPDKEHIVKNIRPDKFADLHAAVAQILEFEKPSSKSVSETERAMAEHKLNLQNGKRVYGFLKKTGFKVASRVIDQIKNTRRLLESQGLHHNDEHERNFMVMGDQTFLIDFAKASHHVAEGSEVHIEEGLEQFTERYEIAKAEEEAASKTLKLKAIRENSTKVTNAFDSVVKLSEGDSEKLRKVVINRGVGSTTNLASLEEFLSLLVKLTDEGKLTKSQSQEVMNDVKQSLVVIEKKGRKTTNRVTNQFVFNNIDNYRELFS